MTRRNKHQQAALKKSGFASLAEEKFSKKLSAQGLRWEYEPDKIVWVPKSRVYTPDFKVWLPDGDDDDYFYIEYKGYFDPKARTKMARVKEQHPELDIRFVFLQANNKLNKRSKTRYWEWAEKKGFPWADDQFPRKWLKKL